jgi:hydroxymethylglutaryl-CoA synthase
LQTGILSYGVAIPKYRIEANEIWKVWKNLSTSFFDKLSIGERGVLGPEEDTLTLAAAAARMALSRSGIPAEKIGAVLLGSGTSPYATKAAATILVDALGLNANIIATDVQCADKSGSTALWLAAGMIESGLIETALVIGADTLNRHTQPGMVLEYVASAGAVAFVLGKENPIAQLEAFATHSHDQNDYFRTEGERFIQPGAGFYGWVANWGLLDHVVPAGKALFEKTSLTPADFSKFAVPQKTGVRPLMTMGKLELDFAEPGEREGVIDYGAGAGCDAWSLVCTEALAERRPETGLVIQLLDDKIMVDYATMSKFEQKLIQSPHRLSNFY